MTVNLKPDIIDRLGVARDLRHSQGLPFELFVDAISEIIRLRSDNHLPSAQATFASVDECLVDVDEAAEILQLDAMQMYVRSARDGTFPRPVHSTGKIPQWRRADLEMWASAHAA